MNRSKLLKIVLLFAWLGLTAFSYGKPLMQELPSLAQSIGKQLITKKFPKVAVLDFTNVQGKTNELGRLVAEQLLVNMVSIEGLTVIDRANINSIMNEHQLTAEGLVKPENAKKLGQFAGVDTLMIGSLATMDNSFTLTVKAISTETAVVVAAAQCQFDVTPDLMKQFSSGINDSGGIAADKPKDDGGSTQDQKGIATKKFGNLEIVLASVAQSSAKNPYGDDISAVECIFEIFNRDIRNTAIVAANGVNMTQNIYSGNTGIRLSGYRGELRDSSGACWTIPSGMLQGLSSILCIDYVSTNINDSIEQASPGAAVKYIQKGRRCEIGPGRQPAIQGSGKYWTGEFTSIPPAESINVVAKFLADGNAQRKMVPDSFKISLELVIGSIADSEEPQSSKSLRLEIVMFDKISMKSE